MLKQSRSIIGFLGVLAAWVFLAGCTSARSADTLQDWKFTHVRLYDAVDAALPSNDFLAFYSRLEEGEVQIRIDWLDHALLADYDLYFLIDSEPGGRSDLPGAQLADIEWDTLILVPTSGEIQSLDSEYRRRAGLALRVTRDPVLDAVTIYLNDLLMSDGMSVPRFINRPPGTVKFQLVLLDPHSSAVLDRSGPFGFYEKPVAPARILLAFSNVYPAYTPALALRRWDGAHSGPDGGRHGLYNLLRAAYGDILDKELISYPNLAQRTPLFLLDLKAPASLSALEFSAGLDLIRHLTSAKLVVLPEYQPDYDPPAEPVISEFIRRLEWSRRMVSDGFNLAPSPIIYSSSSHRLISETFPVVFLSPDRSEDEQARLEPVAISSWQGKTIIPITPRLPIQATAAGPSIELRRALIDSALESQADHTHSDQILVLGGELPSSTWGDPVAARATFRYLESRPWIDALDADDIISISARPGAFDPGVSTFQPQQNSDSQAEIEELVEALLQAPENSLAESAWQMFESLYSPVSPQPDSLHELRKNYTGPIWVLLEASRWVEAPYSITSCTLDLDHDGEPECLMTTDQVFSFFEIDSGALVFLFTMHEDGDGIRNVHQLVGPSSQLISGLSDPAAWVKEGQTLSDPSVITGAFAEKDRNLQPEISGEFLEFHSPVSPQERVYHLLPGGISFSLFYSTPGQGEILMIPIIFDPWERYHLGWAEQFGEVIVSDGWKLIHDSEIQANIQSSAAITSSSFLDSLPYIGSPENPNIDYPAGHYLPFPVFLLSLASQDGMQIEIQLEQN